MEATESSLALSLIGAVQSRHAPSNSEIVDRYCAYRAARGESPNSDGVRALLRTFEEVGGSDQWQGKVASFRRRYSPERALIPAAAIEHAAELLYRHHIDSVADLRFVLSNPIQRAELQAALTAICGSAETWDELLGRVGVRAAALVS